ncbi:MAG: hypothetical protein ACFFCT_12905 [Candidatus Odinarchaeota archaeon]
MELYGVGPRVIAIIMIVITIAFPLGVMPSSVITGDWDPDSRSWIVYSLVWAFDTQFQYLPFGAITYLILYLTLPLIALNILYIRQMVRYYYGEVSRYSAVMVGAISIILPTLLALGTSGFFLPQGEYMYVGPIPIQFIAGLILLYKVPGPDPISPWAGVFIDMSWWAQKKVEHPEWWKEVYTSEEEDIDEFTREDERIITP